MEGEGPAGVSSGAFEVESEALTGVFGLSSRVLVEARDLGEGFSLAAFSEDLEEADLFGVTPLDSLEVHGVSTDLLICLESRLTSFFPSMADGFEEESTDFLILSDDLSDACLSLLFSLSDDKVFFLFSLSEDPSFLSSFSDILLPVLDLGVIDE